MAQEKLTLADVNFAPTSSRDKTVYGSCKPGGAGGAVTEEAISQWADVLKKEGVTRVVSLLEPRETSIFQTSLTDQYSKHFKK